MKKDFENATVVASENENVAGEATSINNFNSNEMEEEKENATGVATENVAYATGKNVNAAEDAASVNQKPNDMAKKNEKVVPTTKIAIIDGVEKEITIAYTKYSMELPEYNEKLCEKLDRKKLLPFIYNLTKPDIFWKEGLKLYDRTGKVIEEETANVYVCCSTADSWRVWVDEKLERIEIVDFNSVQEYAQVIGVSNLYSRGLNNTEKIGIAALATGNKAYQAVFEFAKSHKLTPTTASLYLNVKMTKLQMMKMSTGLVPKAEPELGRSVDEAEVLLSKVIETFGGDARKRYAIRAINVLDHQDNYNLDMIITAMEELTQTELNEIEIASSDTRESTISIKLTEHIKNIPPKETVDKEAA